MKKNDYICNTETNNQNFTIMKQTYRITIFTTKNVIEKDFDKKRTAVETVMNFKKCLDDFIMGVISKETEGKWNVIYSIN